MRIERSSSQLARTHTMSSRAELFAWVCGVMLQVKSSKQKEIFVIGTKALWTCFIWPVVPHLISHGANSVLAMGRSVDASLGSNSLLCAGRQQLGISWGWHMSNSAKVSISLSLPWAHYFMSSKGVWDPNFQSWKDMQSLHVQFCKAIMLTDLIVVVCAADVC